MSPEIWGVIGSAVGAALVALLIGLVRYVFKKGGMELSKYQWEMVQWALDDAVRFAEQKALNTKTLKGDKMPSDEKMKLAMDTSQSASQKPR